MEGVLLSGGPVTVEEPETPQWSFICLLLWAYCAIGSKKNNLAASTL